MGVLLDAYMISDAAFVGASLVNIGGHNPLEACMFGTPVVIGPYHHVQQEAVKVMKDYSVCVEAKDEDALIDSFETFLKPGPHDLRKSAKEVFSYFQGSAKKIYNILDFV